MPGVALPVRRISPARSGRCCGRSRSTPAVTDVYGDVARSTYHSLQLTAREAAIGRWADRELQLHVQPDRRTISTARTGYNFDQDWAVGVNDQPHVWNAMVVYNMPFGRGRQAGQRQSGRAGDRQGLADLRASRSSGPAVRSDRLAPRAICRTPGTCYADYNPAFTGAVRINGDYGDGDVLGADAARLHRSQRRSSRPRRSPTATRRGRSRSTSAIRATSTRISACAGTFHVARVRLGLGIDVFNVFNTVVFGGIQTNITNANFGRVSSQANTPRVGQIKVRRGVLIRGRHRQIHV